VIAPGTIFPMAYWCRRVFLLAIPLILSNLTQPLLSTVDTILSGHLPGPAALGGVTVGSMLISFLAYLPLAIALEKRLGNNGLWCAFSCFMVLRGVNLGLRLPRIENSFADRAAKPAVA
jgi:Na+-driven multidrug efflux pump